MRLLLGIVLGALLTIGGAFLYDQHNATQATEASAAARRPGVEKGGGCPTEASSATPRPMVNWDVVSVKWQHLTERARSEWTRVAG
jgi:hypothetical protein